VDDLLQLWSHAREEMSRGSRTPGTSPEQVRPRLALALREDSLHVVMARWSGQPVGYALMRLSALAPLVEGSVLHVEHLFVLAEFRRHGVARSLLAAVASTAERCGADQVVTSAPPGARDTHRYLARLGFSPMVVRRVAATSVLRRRLAGESSRGALEDLLSRRRSLRARAGWAARWNEAAAEPEAPVLDESVQRVPPPAPATCPPDTLELPLVSDTDLFTEASPRPV
jgi:GNAT superfamily N-acetyltransferase